ncbi:MAG: hypothetical protein JRI93_04415 [Deltaproteobacteria bacterium]|nr:hypothetical protein [Deltaproteobacteria bacterium]
MSTLPSAEGFFFALCALPELDRGSPNRCGVVPAADRCRRQILQYWSKITPT